VLDGADLRPGDHAADLYAGVGLFTAFLAQGVGPEGRVASVESDPGGSRDARRNLHDLAQVQLIDRTTERSLRDGSLVGSLEGRVDVVVLDPPRTGAKRAIADIVELRPRRIVYVACDPAALARDLVAPLAAGYQLVSLRGFALFPMTHHVECVAVLALP
ncbi:MAG: class I SAM-dependent RNA methyltransferase, partial [Actinomycetales bacterium]